MTINQFLLAIPDIADLSLRSKILLVGHFLRTEGQTNFNVNELNRAFLNGGLPLQNKLGPVIASMAKGDKPDLIPLGGRRYSLSVFSVKEIDIYLMPFIGIMPAMKSLEKLSGKLLGGDAEATLLEVKACVRAEAKRAAIVMFWALVVDHLREYVLLKKLSDFNSVLTRDPKAIPITRKDDFLELKDDKNFIDLLRASKIVTKDLHRILEEKLGFRNTCAHPNGVLVPEGKVVVTISDLVDNIVLRYF